MSSGSSSEEFSEELDLNEDPGQGLPRVSRPVSRERTRRGLAYVLLAMVAVLGLGGQLVLVRYVRPLTWEVERDFLTIVFVPIVTAATTALGFFFAQHHR